MKFNSTTLAALTAFCFLASAVVFAPLAHAEGEANEAYMPDRVAELLMAQARAANMTICEGILVPIGPNGTYRLTYRLVRPGDAMVPRPANSMTALIQSGNCPR